MQLLKLSEIETVSYEINTITDTPSHPFYQLLPPKKQRLCETEDMILFYLLLKQNALRDFLLIGVFLVLFNCT